MNLNFEKMNGLIPAIAQDASSGKVLMLGFMNAESFEKTLASGYLTFYSRTRQRLWMKGEESGHRLKMMSWTGDCDDDTVLFQVKAMGPTCHLKTESCFGDWEKDLTHDFSFLQTLENIIDKRMTGLDQSSYTKQLLQSGEAKIAQKIGEEAVETVIAFLGQSRQELIEESADLLFHLLVGLRSKGVGLKNIVECLESRQRPI